MAVAAAVSLVDAAHSGHAVAVVPMCLSLVLAGVVASTIGIGIGAVVAVWGVGVRRVPDPDADGDAADRR